MNVQIREAAEGDAEGLIWLFVEVNDLHVEALPHMFQRITADEETADYLREQIAGFGRRVFVAEQAGVLAGFIVVAVHRAAYVPVYRSRRYAEIEILVVGKPFRRQGIGRALVQRAHDWAADKGINQVELVVVEFNEEASAFYEQLGYTTLNRRMWRSLPPASREGEADVVGNEP